MFAQDKTAFVEAIEVAKGNKHAQKKRRRVAQARAQALHLALEVRVAREALQRMEESVATSGASGRAHASGSGAWVDVASEREVEAARVLLDGRRRKLAAAGARLARLEEEAPEREAAPVTFKMYRLHSSSHHVECPERRFARWSAEQRYVPVWVTTRSGRRWWWFSDRFWWDNQGLKADEVARRVFELDERGRLEREEIERVRAETFRRRPRGG